MNLLKNLLSFLLVIFLAACAGDNNKTYPTRNIAILMPLTGTHAQMGQRIASMIELGLEDSLEGQIKVMTYDAADDTKISAAVSKIKSNGTKLVLGPVFSANAINLIPQIKPSGMTMITLSNNPALATDNIYVFGHSPMKQTERIINYMLDAGYKDYIMLLPANKYSKEMSNIVSDMVSARGSKLVQSEFYTDRQESIEVAVENIVKIVENINESEESNTKPVLYISDEPTSLRALFDALKKHNLDISTVLVGDNKIDIEYSAQITYIFTGSIEYPKDRLLERLKQNFPEIQHLTYMDLMGYDLGKITAHTLGQGLTSEQFNLRLDSGHIHQGASGDVQFIGHIADRRYDIIKRDGSLYDVVDIAK